MRDIGQRIQRYRLSRYGRTQRTLPIKWALLGIFMWALWAGLVSDHSFYHLWRLERSSTRERAHLKQARQELAQLDEQTKDMHARLSEAERRLREDEGWSRPNEIIYRIDDDAASSAKP